MCCYLKSGRVNPVSDPIVTSGIVTKSEVPVKSPPIGIRSAPPLGGWGTGTLEIRADGHFTEITILNQSPGSAPKWANQDGFLVAARFVPAGSSTAAVAALRTHPPAGIAGVGSLQFGGASPVVKLSVGAADSSGLPAGTSLYGFGRVHFGLLNESNTPAISLPVTMTASGSASVLYTVPLAEQNLTRMGGAATLTTAPSAATPTQCMAACNANAACQSWVLAPAAPCTLLSNAPVPLPAAGVWSGPRTSVASGTAASGAACVVGSRDAVETLQGQIAACAASAVAGIAWGSQQDIFAQFAAKGTVSGMAPSAGSGSGAPVAAIVAEAVPQPGGELLALGAVAWYFEDYRFMGEAVGNFYTTHFRSAVDAVSNLVDPDDVAATVASYAAVQDALRPSVLDANTRDVMLNMLHHFRMPFYTADGRVRSFEAYDCVNIDSVHNDHERAVPYLMAMPEFAISKMRGWAAGQLANGMIQEQLGCGCQGAVPMLDDACGRVMSDVSSQFIVYLLELKQGGFVDVVAELWPNAAAAANWHISVSQKYGIPDKLQTTYDVLGLNAYDTSTYSSLFHLLAMRSCSVLAEAVGDARQKGICDNATLVAQRALDNRHWVEDAGPPPPGAPTGGHAGPWSYYRSYCDAGSIDACGPAPVNATMADDTFAQVIAFNLGLGPLVANLTRLKLHLQAVAIRHETPYGMMIMVGRELPYPGTARDNALWQMASPNWAALAISTGLAPADGAGSALATAQRALQWWRSGDAAPGRANPNATGTAARNPTGLADQWNIAGVVGGIGLAEEGAPWITAHYGYAITAWRIYLAMSGQAVDLSTGAWSFSPSPGAGRQAGSWAVVLVGAVGKLEISVQEDAAITATLSLASGPPAGVPVNSLRIAGVDCPLPQKLMLQVGSPITCPISQSSSA